MFRFIGFLTLVGWFVEKLFSYPMVRKVAMHGIARLGDSLDHAIYSESYLEHIRRRNTKEFIEFTGEKYKIPRKTTV